MTLPFLGYLLACLVVGFVLTIFVSMFRSTRKVDEFKSWYWVVGFSIFAGLAPYGYAEFMTRKHGVGMVKPIKRALVSAQVNGKLIYYKVLQADENKAKVVAVAREKGQFGEMERTVIEVDMVKEKSAWSPISFEVVNSYKRQKDGTTLPPFW